MEHDSYPGTARLLSTCWVGEKELIAGLLRFLVSDWDGNIWQVTTITKRSAEVWVSSHENDYECGPSLYVTGSEKAATTMGL